MPCTDGGYGAALERDRIYAENKLLTAMLCGAIGALKSLDGIDFKECGVTKGDYTRWWAEHQRADAIRKDREKKALAAKRARDEALSKLSPADRKALNLNGKEDW